MPVRYNKIRPQNTIQGHAVRYLTGCTKTIPSVASILKSLIFCSVLTICFFQSRILFAQATQEWARRFSGNGFASGLSVKLDAGGNVYVLMKLYTDTTLNDYGLAKYDPQGYLNWNTYYNSPGNWSDDPVAFDVAPGGEVYITGSSSYNFVRHNTTVKFNSGGILQWAKTYSSGGPSDDTYDIKVDRSGNIIVVGVATINNNMSYGLTIKYSTAGDTLWVRKLTQLSPYSGFGKESIDDSNNIYICGEYGNSNSDYLIAKYNTEGLYQWHTLYDSPEHYDDVTWDISNDSSGNAYVIGSNSVPTALSNNTLLKINTNGNIMWSNIFTGIAGISNGCSIPAGVVTARDGSFVCFSTACYNGTTYKIVTLRFNPNGDSTWIRIYGGGLNYGQNSEPSSIKSDRFGNTYVTGLSYFQGTGTDYVTLKYDATGTQTWVASYNGPLSNSDDECKDLIIDTNYNVYVTGASSRQNSPIFLWDAATIKYSQPIGIINNQGGLPKDFVLHQNYPNPFNPVTVIEYEIPKHDYVELRIFDITGRLVKVPVSRTLEAGYYSAAINMSDCASGIYFYTLITNTLCLGETKKMILVK